MQFLLTIIGDIDAPAVTLTFTLEDVDAQPFTPARLANIALSLPLLDSLAMLPVSCFHPD